MTIFGESSKAQNVCYKTPKDFIVKVPGSEPLTSAFSTIYCPEASMNARRYLLTLLDLSLSLVTLPFAPNLSHTIRVKHNERGISTES